MEELLREHVQDLKRSGIRRETAEAAALRSIDNNEVVRLLGFSVQETMTGLVFPYGSNGFFRVKLFPPTRDMKYAQPKGSGTHLYVPPYMEAQLKNPDAELLIVEGEKKALKGSQEGFPCIGIGGLWNWLENGAPTADFNAISWLDRSVGIVPDSDVWSREDLKRAVYALGMELEGRGASVEMIHLPPEAESKVGLDDYLVAFGEEQFASLKRTTLKHNVFNRAKKWHKDWIKRKEQGPDDEPQVTTHNALELLERAQSIQTLHPAQDFINDTLWYGIPVVNELFYLNSSRKLLRPSDLAEGMVGSESPDMCRFSKEGIKRYLDGSDQSGTELLGELVEYFKKFLILYNERNYYVLAAWTMGTYLYRVFRVFPYLQIQSPDKACGKSRMEDALSLVCFNASQRETSPTEAVLFRWPGKTGGTVLLDEMENLRSDKDRFGNLLAVLNSGFEAGGSVSRVEKRGERFETVSYPTYCPRVLAGIRSINDVLASRCIPIFMQRKLRTEQVERFSRPRLWKVMQPVRDKLYTWALCHAPEVPKIYEGIDSFKALDRIGDRERDLWEPLISIGLLCDEETGEAGKMKECLIEQAVSISDIKAQVEAGDVAEIVRVLEKTLAGQTEVRITPTDLLARFKLDSAFEWVKSARRLAGLLSPLGLVSTTLVFADEGKRKRGYKITQALLDDCKVRYGVDQ